MTTSVRLFAGAADAAGTEATTSASPSVGRLREDLAARFGGDFARVLQQCSVMVDGAIAEPADAIPSGATVDVLPPFAGG